MEPFEVEQPVTVKKAAPKFKDFEIDPDELDLGTLEDLEDLQAGFASGQTPSVRATIDVLSKVATNWTREDFRKIKVGQFPDLTNAIYAALNGYEKSAVPN